MSQILDEPVKDLKLPPQYKWAFFISLLPLVVILLYVLDIQFFQLTGEYTLLIICLILFVPFTIISIILYGIGISASFKHAFLKGKAIGILGFFFSLGMLLLVILLAFLGLGS